MNSVGARQPGSVPFDSDTDVVDQRTRLAYVLSVGNNYFIGALSDRDRRFGYKLNWMTSGYSYRRAF